MLDREATRARPGGAEVALEIIRRLRRCQGRQNQPERQAAFTALGVLLCELLAGRPPFDPKDLMAAEPATETARADKAIQRGKAEHAARRATASELEARRMAYASPRC